jgi:hypothetical protein
MLFLKVFLQIWGGKNCLGNGRVIARATERWLLTTGAWVQFHVTSSEIRGERSGTGAGFSPSSSVFSC